jgi:hypothetical protein
MVPARFLGRRQNETMACVAIGTTNSKHRAFLALEEKASPRYCCSTSLCIQRVNKGESARQMPAVINAATAICPKTFP